MKTKIISGKNKHTIDECVCVNLDITMILPSSEQDEKLWRERRHKEKIEDKKCHIYNGTLYCFGDE